MPETRSISRLMLAGDHDLLRQRTGLLPTREQEFVRQEYKRRFLAAMDAEPVGHRKENAGRRAANLWLIDYVDGA